MKRKNYKIVGCYDTETTNIIDENNPENNTAFVCLYIFSDIRNTNVRDYVPDKEIIRFYRTYKDAINYINELIAWGKENETVPIICSYNLIFDLYTIIYELSKTYEIDSLSQSGQSAYTVSLLSDGSEVLRFWDTFYLEMGGLSAMGETCGFKKAIGDWDYSLNRSDKTELTEKELFYAKRDVQVILCYLQYLLDSNDWLTEDMFGVRLLTKTSTVRLMASDLFTIVDTDENTYKLKGQFAWLCKSEFPKTYSQYATRKACFRGGLTFTSATYAGHVNRRVYSVDAVSMHHTFINGKLIPVKFIDDNSEMLKKCVEYVRNVSVQDVFRNYHKPFKYAFHAKIKFTNIRLKENTIFEKAGIAIIPQAKFKKIAKANDYFQDESKLEAFIEVAKSGFVDVATQPLFAFGKLYQAKEIEIFVNEIEFWNINFVYDYGSYEVMSGEYSHTYRRPPDYVSLQSNVLFEMKSACKEILKYYKEGEKYTRKISELIPENIRIDLQEGTLNYDFLKHYYTSTVKGQFNSIYGTMAQDVFRPSYKFTNEGFIVDETTKITRLNWDDFPKQHRNVLYTYGMRIVGNSRMHLILCMYLLDKKLGNMIKITGGDTDSIKIATSESVTEKMIIDAIEPLKEISKNAIDYSQQHIRECFPQYASQLNDIGSFEIEKAGNDVYYDYHIEYWNKARISIDTERKSHITFAGLSQPKNKFSIKDGINVLIKAYPIDFVLTNVLGFNVYVDKSISGNLSQTIPAFNSFRNFVGIDYLGNKYSVQTYECKCLYENGRLLGDTKKYTNKCTATYTNNFISKPRVLYKKGNELCLKDLITNEMIMRVNITTGKKC